MATSKNKLMENKTKSKIPKNSTEKRQWIQARKVVAKQSGAKSESGVPWGLVTHIYQNEKKAGKTITPKDVSKTKPSKAVKSYKTNKG